MRVNLNGEKNAAGNVFAYITIGLALGLNGLVVAAWLTWTRLN